MSIVSTCQAETNTEGGAGGAPSAAPTRVLVVTPIPTPYRDPFWAEVARRPEIDLEVVYCSAGKGDRPWKQDWENGFRSRVLRGYNLARFCGAGASCYWNPEIIGLLRSGSYDVIVAGGYNHLTMLTAIAYARCSGTPYGLMSEVYLRQPRSRWRRILKAPLVRSIVRHARGCLPTGTLASEYLVHYGASETELCRIPNVPDVEGFHRRARELRPQRAALRQARGLDEQPMILFVSRLIGLKRVDLLLDATKEVLKERDATLVILGDGPMRGAWEEHAAKLGIAGQVRFEGFIAPASLPEWYAMADLFVLPSVDETWSVVVVEALASGVPVVITDLVGCCVDVVNDARVGSVVPAGEAEPLAEAMRQHLAAQIPREELMDLWAPVRRTMTYPLVADRFVQCMREWREGPAGGPHDT
jgi:glycosyltransferase involved in cell wall biosynthesis